LEANNKEYRNIKKSYRELIHFPYNIALNEELDTHGKAISNKVIKIMARDSRYKDI